MSDAGNFAIYSRFRYKGGAWQTTELVNPAVVERYVQNKLNVSIDSAGNGYAMWDAYGSSSLRRVYFTTHPVGGVWQATELVGAFGTAEQIMPDLAVTPSGTAHAVWIDTRSGKGHVYYSSRQPGNAWEPEQQIDTQGSTTCKHPQIATDTLGNVVAMWVYDSGDIYSGHKTSGGAWSPSTRVNQGSSGGLPSISLDGMGNAYATWVHYGTIMFAMTQPVFYNSWKAADSLIVVPGSTSTYQISIYNTLPFSTAFEVTDEFPEHTTYITGTLAASQGITSTNGGMITWTGTIWPSQTLTATFEVEVSSTITQTESTIMIVNQASAAASTQEGGTTLRVVTFVNPYQVHLPLVQRH
jgi:hypothetical protein